MKVKKIGSLLLALVMCFSLMSVAWAADGDEGHTVTIDNPYDGYVYVAYQIFSGVEAEEYNDQGVLTHTYLSDITWGNGIDGDAFLKALQEAADAPLAGLFTDCKSAAEVAAVLGEYQEKDNEVAVAFAKLAKEYLIEANVAGTSGTVDETKWDETNECYYINGLADGYYLIYNTAVGNQSGDGKDYEGAYTDYILTVVEDVEVTHKGTIPEIDKVITDNDDNQKEINNDGRSYTNDYTGVVADYSIGDSVPYTIYVTMPDEDTLGRYTEYKLVIHDKMSDGLTFNNDVTVKVGDTTLTAGVDYVLAYDKENNSFTITFEDTKKVEALVANAVIEVSFSATLNSDAVVGVAETNETYLDYSNNPNDTGTGESPHIKVYAFTFELDVNKVTTSGAPLEGAEFVLKDSDTADGTGEKYLAIYEYDEDTGLYDKLVTNSTDLQEDTAYEFGWVIPATGDDDQNYTIFGSDETSNFSIVGLDEGTYYLEEIKAPEGYNMLTSAIPVTINAYYKVTDGVVELDYITVSVDTTGVTATEERYTDGKGAIDVVNNHGDELPSTGGIGTAIFYIIGGVLVVGAAVVLIARRRMNSDAE